MRQIWFTSDQHHYHSNILAFRTDSGRQQRPFTTCAEMTRTILKRHNEVVAKDDTVYHLGDFSFAKSWKEVRPIVEKMNGHHHLIAGNHDTLRIWDYLEAGFLSVHTSLEVADLQLVHDPAVAGVVPGQFWVHGHTHNLALRLNKNTYCVCVELHNYYPVSLEQIEMEVFGCS